MAHGQLDVLELLSMFELLVALGSTLPGWGALPLETYSHQSAPGRLFFCPVHVYAR